MLHTFNILSRNVMNINLLVIMRNSAYPLSIFAMAMSIVQINLMKVKMLNVAMPELNSLVIMENALIEREYVMEMKIVLTNLMKMIIVNVISDHHVSDTFFKLVFSILVWSDKNVEMFFVCLVIYSCLCYGQDRSWSKWSRSFMYVSIFLQWNRI